MAYLNIRKAFDSNAHLPIQGLGLSPLFLDSKNTVLLIYELHLYTLDRSQRLYTT